MKKEIVIVVIIILILSSILYYYVSTHKLGNRRRGMLIRFLSSVPLNWTKVEAQIIAITPDGDMELFRGFINKSGGARMFWCLFFLATHKG